MLRANRRYVSCCAIALAMVAILLPACNRGGRSKGLVGQWLSSKASLEINEDGTLIGNFEGEVWTSRYEISSLDRSKATTTIPTAGGGTYELSLVSNDKLQITPVENGTQITDIRIAGGRARLARRMLLSRSAVRR